MDKKNKKNQINSHTVSFVSQLPPEVVELCEFLAKSAEITEYNQVTLGFDLKSVPYHVDIIVTEMRIDKNAS